MNRSWAALAVGVVVASTSAALIRYADTADALAISFWRCAAAAVALAPFARRKRAGRGRVDRWIAMVAGLFLALHFATWITSVDLTTIAASVLLVSTTPVVVAAAARVLFGERIPPAAWAGIGAAIAGAAIVGGADLTGSSLGGNLLALAGAVAAAGYFMATERCRRSMGALELSVVAYASAAGLLAIACVVGRVPLWGYDSTTWWAIAGLIAGPQLIGHTLINFVLKDIDSTTVSVVLLAEPVVATAMAAWLFAEVPSVWVYPGGGAILGGIYLVSHARRQPVLSID